MKTLSESELSRGNKIAEIFLQESRLFLIVLPLPHLDERRKAWEITHAVVRSELKSKKLATSSCRIQVSKEVETEEDFFTLSMTQVQEQEQSLSQDILISIEFFILANNNNKTNPFS